MAVEEKSTATVHISNIPKSAIAKELLDFFESQLGKDSVFAINIFTEHKNWKSKGFGRVQFETLDSKSKAIALSQQCKLIFKKVNLKLTHSANDVIYRPIELHNRVDCGILHTGLMSKDDHMYVLESWGDAKFWVMPERRSLEFWVDHDKECYKLELQFSDVLETVDFCDITEKSNLVVLKLKHGPKIYQKMSGPNVSPKFCSDNYNFCKDDFDFLWVRTTDFSGRKSIGQSSTLCWENEEGSSDSEMFSSLPLYKKKFEEFILEECEEFHSSSETVPLVRFSESNLAYDILFQINSLVHTQKISLAAVDAGLIELLSSLDVDSAMVILQKLHKRESTCYDPVGFINTHKHFKQTGKHLPSSSQSLLANNNMMRCHRVYVTPSKIYCLGPELETSNHIVKHYAAYASDFMRVTFVEEDWGRLGAYAMSTSIQQGIFSKPLKTKIYQRILNILREGIVIGSKRFQFLAFSASQLRSNSVWMFASNEHVKAEDIRAWMGCFNSIRSISKCAARMGQLFSSSRQTMEVPPKDLQIIPDIEVTTDGVNYCFSDGIGKISLPFATLVAKKCGLDYTPSAFQIRYGGYKGVIAVDRNSFRKLSLRGSMLKFESKNRMLNVTKWCDSGPCYLNREIVTLLSTLGVEDEAFLKLQETQLHFLDKMLTSKEAALDVLDSLGPGGIKNILVKMLFQDCEPNMEPYLSMMIQSLRENLLSDLRSRCRIFVPKGRILLGCLDETGILNYGQVFVRVTLTKNEKKSGEQKFFHKVSDSTSIVVGKVVVTKNPCLHPGDVRVLDAVYEVVLEEKGLVDCIVFPQKGERPHPNECSGGDLDGDLYFISWDESLIPHRTVAPMDYSGRRPRIMDHEVTMEEIQQFFTDYMINDTLGTISTAHLVHSDREPEKASSPKCLELANLHSMAVDYAKTGAPAEMPSGLRPKEFPDFMERPEKPMYISQGALGKLYRATKESGIKGESMFVWSKDTVVDAYDGNFTVEGFEDFIEIAESHKEMYWDKLTSLMMYYDAKTEDEILTGNLRNKSAYLQRDNRRFGETKDRILVSIKSLHKDAKSWFERSCKNTEERQKLASAWYHVTYHKNHCQETIPCLGLPWVVGDVLLDIKSVNSCKLKLPA